MELYNLPLLLVVLLNRVMGITPDQLLLRLQAKAGSMGDPNPWLVQVSIVHGGLAESPVLEHTEDRSLLQLQAKAASMGDPTTWLVRVCAGTRCGYQGGRGGG